MARNFGRYPWSLVDDLLTLQDEMNEIIEGRRRYYPPVNIWRSGEEIVVDFFIPGADPKQMEIEIKDGILSVKNKRGEDDEKRAYIIRERREGEFSRSFHLPYKVDKEKAVASYKNGVLRIKLLRAEEDKPRRILIEG